MKKLVLQRCQSAFPDWADLSVDDVDFDDPKGFSSFTMAVRPRRAVHPTAAFYRRLEGKENAILDFDAEKTVFLTLGQGEIAARCHTYQEGYRIEELYQGRTLRAEELRDPENLRRIAKQLSRLHRTRPQGLPERSFFELLHEKWGRQARSVLDRKGELPEAEQRLCDELREIYSEETFEKVKRCLPDGELTFCHNDTYHGNIMRLEGGELRLLDFEFSCLGHRSYDFSNLFAETVMRHQQPDPPYFRIAEPQYTSDHIAQLIGFYLDESDFVNEDARETTFRKLLQDTEDMLPLSDYVYAMAAVPLALDPIQRIRFIPYAHARFSRFLGAYEQRFGK